MKHFIAIWLGLTLCLAATVMAVESDILTDPMDENEKAEPAIPLGLMGPIPGITPSDIIIGQCSPQSGPAAPWGALARGTGVYFQWINSKGGIQGRRLKLLLVDDRYNPALTRLGVKKLAEEHGIFAFVGGVGTATGLAAMDYIVDKNIPWVGMASGSTKWAFPPKRNIFAICPPSQDEAAALAEYAIQVMGRTRIAIIYQNDEFGRSGLEGVLNRLGRHGLSPAVQVPVEVTDRDLKDETEALRQVDPEVVIMWLNPTHAILLHREAKARNFRPIWMTGSALSDAATMNKLTGRSWIGTIFTSFAEPPDSKLPVMQAYRQAYNRFAPKGERWGPFFYTGFGLAEPLAEALHRCGPDPTREKFIRQMEGLKNYKGILGHITYGPNQRQGQREIYISQAMKHGKFQQLTGWFTMESR